MKPESLLTVTLARLSLCPCGFTALHDHIPLGTEYQIDISMPLESITWVCGGCGKAQGFFACYVLRQGTHAGYLPENLFSHHPSNQNQTTERTE